MKARMSLLPGAVLLFAVGLFCPPSQGQTTKALLLFGGKDHKTFLGCFNCVASSSASVCNVAGDFGSIVSDTSIWNIVGKFGSIVSDESPWSIVASDPPIIVDKDGNSYGYFTENIVHDQTHIPWLVNILNYYDKKDDLDKTRDKMCGDEVEDDDN